MLIKLIKIQLIFSLVIISGCATKPPITLFPIEKYNQNINNWVKPADSDYEQPLIKSSDQAKYLKEYYKHYCAGKSPWNKAYVGKILPTVLSEEKSAISAHSNKRKTKPEKIGYGENFHPYSEKWIKNIIANMNIEQFTKPIKFKYSNRGIAVRNLHARILPTNDVHFHSFMLAGQGYPFDNLQQSSLWVGTPVYIIGATLDKQWYLVLTPECTAWVESDGIAKVNKKVVAVWQKTAEKKMVAIVRTNTSIFDTNKQYRFNAYVGAVFPGKSNNTILIPVADEYHNAHIMLAKVSKKDAAVMPLSATSHNFTIIMSTLIGRPYGWGNMYFYNDCSAEMKNFYTPFGIWLPRHSSNQMEIGRTVDKSSLDMQGRLNYLMTHGRKFTTIIYIGGHVLMYLGAYPNPDLHSKESKVAMTYQSIWGLRPEDNSYRAVIGGSVLLPMLTQYPENSEVISLADKKQFQVSYLDELRK